MRLMGKRALILGLLVVVAMAGWSVRGAYGKASESAAQKDEAEAQYADLQKRESQLSANIAKLKTERGKEEELRQQYALAAQGEKMIVIVDAPKSTSAPATSTRPSNWFTRLFSWW